MKHDKQQGGFDEPRGKETTRGELPSFASEALPNDAVIFLKAMERRYACKLFTGEALPESIEDYILECGRLSPSSFGLEHWKFIAVRTASIRDRLFAACFAQECVRTASLVVAIVVRRVSDYDLDSAFVKARAERFPGGFPVFREDYRAYYEYLSENGLLDSWAKAQSYIAAANMMTGAAAADIDSCAIEGYNESEVLAALGEAPGEWRVGIITVFGHRAEAPREKIREDFSTIVEFR